jgi:hypothetical protein
MSIVTEAINAFARGITLAGCSEVSLAAAMLCQLQLCTVVLGSSPGHCCILDINMVTKQATSIVQGATFQMTVILTPICTECLAHLV